PDACSRRTAPGPRPRTPLTREHRRALALRCGIATTSRGLPSRTGLEPGRSRPPRHPCRRRLNNSHIDVEPACKHGRQISELHPPRPPNKQRRAVEARNNTPERALCVRVQESAADSHVPYGLPEDPALADVALALRAAGHWAGIVDDQW